MRENICVRKKLLLVILFFTAGYVLRLTSCKMPEHCYLAETIPPVTFKSKMNI